MKNLSLFWFFYILIFSFIFGINLKTLIYSVIFSTRYNHCCKSIALWNMIYRKLICYTWIHGIVCKLILLMVHLDISPCALYILRADTAKLLLQFFVLIVMIFKWNIKVLKKCDTHVNDIDLKYVHLTSIVIFYAYFC